MCAIADVAVLGIVFGVCVLVSYLIHKNRNNDIKNLLKALGALDVPLPPTNDQSVPLIAGNEDEKAKDVSDESSANLKIAAITMLDLDQQIAQVHRSRNLIQIGFLVLAGLAVIEIGILSRPQVLCKFSQPANEGVITNYVYLLPPALTATCPVPLVSTNTSSQLTATPSKSVQGVTNSP